MTKADIVTEIAKTTCIDKASVIPAHNIPAFKPYNAFKVKVTK